MIKIGIDPGLGGAIAISMDSQLTVYDMPTFTLPINGEMRRVIDEDTLAGILAPFGYSQSKVIAIVENVHAMPKQGVTSSFTFGRGYGAVRGILAAFKIPRRYVEPKTWKRALGLSSDKDRSRQLASQLMPDSAKWWPLKKHDGRAESALLIYYAEKYIYI